MTDQMTMSN